jgi:hypothetical protein
VDALFQRLEGEQGEQSRSFLEDASTRDTELPHLPLPLETPGEVQ